MSLRRAVGALALSALVATAAWAQGGVLDLLGSSGAGRNVTTPSAGPPLLGPLSGPVDPAEYTLGPGDVLQIVVSGSVRRAWDAMVLPEGALFVPSVGSIPVTGLTLVEAREAVSKRLSLEYRGAVVELRLMRPRTLLVTLAGESPRAGALEVSAASRASEVLTDALLGPNASRRRIELRRHTPQGETRMRLDLVRLRLTGHIAVDPLLREGDVLFVPISREAVAIAGAVGRAGSYELAPGDSLGTLIALSGGPVLDAADDATFVRFRDDHAADSTRFRVSDVLAGRHDLPLRDGDRVFVYYKPRYHRLDQATIFGEVRRPGVYPLPEGGERLSVFVAEAGGFLPAADTAAIRVFRSSGQAGGGDPELERLSQLSRREMTSSEYEVFRARLAARREDFRVDWARATADPALDPVLRAGDVVRVDPVVAAVRVEGEVRMPGLVRFEAGRRAADYIRLAGGYSERAARGQVRVKRAVTGQTILARDVPELEPGDLLWVPDRGDTATWQVLQSVLLVMAQIATVIVAVRR